MLFKSKQMPRTSMVEELSKRKTIDDFVSQNWKKVLALESFFYSEIFVVLYRRHRHFSAFFSALFTNLGTFTAMFVLMLTAFFSTSFADLCTNRTNIFCSFASQTHQLRGSVTNSCTFHVKLNASGHHFYFFFFCAQTCAMIANCSTF